MTSRSGWERSAPSATSAFDPGAGPRRVPAVRQAPSDHRARRHAGLGSRPAVRGRGDEAAAPTVPTTRRSSLQRDGTSSSSSVIVKLDRLGLVADRDLTRLRRTRRPGVGVVSLAEGFDSTPSGKAMRGMLAVFAQFERERIAERTREGLLGQHGTASYGLAARHSATARRRGGSSSSPHKRRSRIFDAYRRRRPQTHRRRSEPRSHPAARGAAT